MSSTNRSDARNAHIADYYVTPVSAIDVFLREFCNDGGSFMNKNILDPCAGGDLIHPMSYPESLKKVTTGAIIRTLDIRSDSLAGIKDDYLKYPCAGEFDIIITNPPFNIALDIIKKALNDVRPQGLVIMLLRLNFFGSRERSDFFKNFMPTWCYVHSKRMRFTDSGGTDSIEYMHAVWVKDNNPKFTHLRVI